jgi:hypothetical protein
MDTFLQNARIWRCTRNLAAKLAGESAATLAEVACHAACHLQVLLRRDLTTEPVFDYAPATPRDEAMRVYGMLEIDRLQARADARDERVISGIELWMATVGVAARPAGLADVLRAWARIAQIWPAVPQAAARLNVEILGGAAFADLAPRFISRLLRAQSDVAANDPSWMHNVHL